MKYTIENVTLLQSFTCTCVEVFDCRLVVFFICIYIFYLSVACCFSRLTFLNGLVPVESW